jgi:hypothetical protein
MTPTASALLSDVHRRKQPQKLTYLQTYRCARAHIKTHTLTHVHTLSCRFWSYCQWVHFFTSHRLATRRANFFLFFYSLVVKWMFKSSLLLYIHTADCVGRKIGFGFIYFYEGTRSMKSECFWRLCIMICKTVLLDFVSSIKYKIIQLHRFGSWVLLPSSGEKDTVDINPVMPRHRASLRYSGHKPCHAPSQSQPQTWRSGLVRRTQLPRRCNFIILHSRRRTKSKRAVLQVIAWNLF